MENYKAIIIDDDHRAIALIKKSLQKNFPPIKLCAVEGSVSKGLMSIEKYRPDIVIMDTRVDGQDTFKLLDPLKEVNSQVIFLSSYKKFALKAIKHQVSDYILKPVEAGKIVVSLKLAVKKVREQKKTAAHLRKPRPSIQKLRYLAIPTMSKIKLLNIEQVMYCEANGKDTFFYLDNGTHLVAINNIGVYEKLLGNNAFFRVHHKYLVNLQMVKHIDKIGGNSCELLHGISLPISTRKIEMLYKFLRLK